MKTKTEIVKEFCEENKIPHKDIKMSEMVYPEPHYFTKMFLEQKIDLASFDEVEYFSPSPRSWQRMADSLLEYSTMFNSIVAATSFYDFLNGKPMIPFNFIKNPMAEEDINKAMAEGKRGDMYKTESKQPEEHGCACVRCKEFYEHAIRKDGFVCRSCKSYESM